MFRAPVHERLRLPGLIFLVCAAVYVLTLGARAHGHSDNAHFVHLANSFLHGQVSVVGNKPPGDNDWAQFGGRWYVSFPPFPAVVIMPAVAIWGTAVWDRLFWAIFAAFGPALLYVLLRHLRETGRTQRSPREDVLLTALFAFGSVYYYTAVQGTVWFAAHVVACPLIALYLLWSLDARRPVLAGLCLGLCFMTRPTTLLLGAVFVIEALQASRTQAADSQPLAADAGTLPRVLDWLRAVSLRQALPRLCLFALPLLAIGGIAMWFNAARFVDPFEFGHSFLTVRWRSRIDKWGLFNYHYLAKNLAVFCAGLPWLSAVAPYLRISRHGLALWFTTPQYVSVLWPKRQSVTMTALTLGAAAVALQDLCYQNSGWIQFGYRFSLDYSVLLIALLALGGRKFGLGFHALLAFACLVNLFGALTFDRAERFYDQDGTQNVMFQPD
ncbi:MAG TPA: hypothetical protein VF331_19800 [Polyangiales bacterium]